MIEKLTMGAHIDSAGQVSEELINKINEIIDYLNTPNPPLTY